MHIIVVRQFEHNFCSQVVRTHAPGRRTLLRNSDFSFFFPVAASPCAFFTRLPFFLFFASVDLFPTVLPRTPYSPFTFSLRFTLVSLISVLVNDSCIWECSGNFGTVLLLTNAIFKCWITMELTMGLIVNVNVGLSWRIVERIDICVRKNTNLSVLLGMNFTVQVLTVQN